MRMSVSSQLMENSHNQNVHKPHLKWIKKIQDVWNKLEGDENHIEACRVENKIKHNKRILANLDQQNLRHHFKVYDIQHRLAAK